MRVQEIIDKITDETKVDELLVDLATLSESEAEYEQRISDLENDISERDERIRELKIDNHELLKKVADSVDFRKNDPEPEVEEIKSVEDIYTDFMER